MKIKEPDMDRENSEKGGGRGLIRC